MSVHFLDLKIFPAWKGFCPFQTDKKLHQAWKVSNCKSMRLYFLGPLWCFDLLQSFPSFQPANLSIQESTNGWRAQNDAPKGKGGLPLSVEEIS